MRFSQVILTSSEQVPELHFCTVTHDSSVLAEASSRCLVTRPAPSNRIILAAAASWCRLGFLQFASSQLRARPASHAGTMPLIQIQ
jgi:hypothetical protein